MREEERHYPPDAEFIIAAREESRRYSLEHPDVGGELRTPATSERMAKKLAADEHPQTDWTDWVITSK